MMIIGVQPSTFPQKVTLDGTEEIYTQTNGTNEKFTVGQVVEHVVAQLDASSVIETSMIPLCFSEVDVPYDNGTPLNVATVFVPTPSVLHPNATGIRVKFVFGLSFEFEGQGANIKLNDALSGPYETAATLTSSADGYIEYYETDWFTPAYLNMPTFITIENNVIDSQADRLTLLPGSVAILQAYN